MDSNIPCVLVASKVDLPEVKQFHGMTPAEFCYKHRLPPPLPFSSLLLDSTSKNIYNRLACAAMYPYVLMILSSYKCSLTESQKNELSLLGSVHFLPDILMVPTWAVPPSGCGWRWALPWSLSWVLLSTELSPGWNDRDLPAFIFILILHPFRPNLYLDISNISWLSKENIGNSFWLKCCDPQRFSKAVEGRWSENSPCCYAPLFCLNSSNQTEEKHGLSGLKHTEIILLVSRKVRQ